MDSQKKASKKYYDKMKEIKKQFYQDNKEKLKQVASDRYQRLKDNEDFKKKKSEYARVYNQKRRIININNLDNVD